MPYFPSDLSETVRRNWKSLPFSRTHPLPTLSSKARLTELFELLFQASMLTEEGRGIRFRVAEMPPGILTRPNIYDGVTIPFATPRALSVNELRRLAPATDYTQTIICVTLKTIKHKKVWTTWGLLETGTSWWNYITIESVSGMVPPNALMISSAEPGELRVTREGETVAHLRQGRITSPGTSPLSTGPIRSFFGAQIRKLEGAIKSSSNNQEMLPMRNGSVNQYAASLYIGYINKILFHVRELRHGGTIIFLRDSKSLDDITIKDRINIKYSITYDGIWEKLIQVATAEREYWHARYAKDGNTKWSELSTPWRDVDKKRNLYEDAESSIRDSAKFIASLSGVDGAVVLTDRLRTLGFGAEVVAVSHSLCNVSIAHDESGSDGNCESIENYGTRHRSAFRLAAGLENSVVFVVSQDKDVKVIKKHGPNVVMWTDVDVKKNAL